MFRTGDLKKLARIGPKGAGRLLEAAAFLLAARLAVQHLPLRRIIRLTGLQASSGAEPQGLSSSDEALKVAKAIAIVQARLPWKSTCLMNALAGAAMLRRRRLPAMLFLGVNRTAQGQSALVAHAWLECDGLGITGTDESASFRQIAAFHSAGKSTFHQGRTV
jgi:hypothetical protein